MSTHRSDFLKLLTTAAASTGSPASIAHALAIPANDGTRTPRPYGPGVKTEAGYVVLPVNNSLVVPMPTLKSRARQASSICSTMFDKNDGFFDRMVPILRVTPR
jgi:hypothetical protein